MIVCKDQEISSRMSLSKSSLHRDLKRVWTSITLWLWLIVTLRNITTLSVLTTYTPHHTRTISPHAICGILHYIALHAQTDWLIMMKDNTLLKGGIYFYDMINWNKYNTIFIQFFLKSLFCCLWSRFSEDQNFKNKTEKREC